MKEYDCFVAKNAEDLLSALERKADKILITKHYREEFLENTELPLGEDNYFSSIRSSAGLGSNPVFLLMNRFSKDDKQQRKIDSKVQKYILKESGEDLLLYLRQFDY